MYSLLNYLQGNSDEDASNTSPANSPNAITVGATDITDSRAYYSNYGPVVDIFAPGSKVTSAWIGGPDYTNTISGTSMATPAVAGLVAYLLNVFDEISTPDLMRTYIQSTATMGKLTDIRK
jgi:subtilisin family serine protease